WKPPASAGGSWKLGRGSYYDEREREQFLLRGRCAVSAHGPPRPAAQYRGRQYVRGRDEARGPPRFHRIEASADSQLPSARGAFSFRFRPSHLGVRPAVRHSEPRSRSETQARDGGRTQGAGRQDRERELGPAAAAVGFHSGASERWAHRNGDSNSSL